MTAAVQLADRLRRIRPSRSDPGHVLGELQELAAEVARLPVPTSPTVLRIEQADPAADIRIRRLVALLRHREEEIEKLRRLVAATARPRSGRRWLADVRQGVLL